MYIIDFSNFAYKFKSVYKFAAMEVSGVKVDLSVVVGFIKCLKSNTADDIVIALDGVPEASNSSLVTYKGTRDKDQEISLGIPKIEVIQFLTKVGERLGKSVKVVCSPLQEADQVISSIVHSVTGNLPPRAQLISHMNTHALDEDRILSYLSSAKVSVYNPPKTDVVVVATTDSDMKALSRFEQVWIDTSASGAKLEKNSTAKVVDYVNPAAITIYKSIFGDHSDNVKGYPIEHKWSKVIDKCIKSDADLKETLEGIKTGNYKPGLKSLFSWIKAQDNFQLFWKNYSIVFLGFYSYPKLIEFPDYDIQSTIDKYKLRI